MSTIPTEARTVAASGARVYEWIPQDDVRVRPEHAARWPASSWLSGTVIKVTALDSAREAQRDQWAAFVRGRRLRKRMKRAQRTTAPDWSHNLRCFVLELQRDPAAVLLTSGCRCPACRTDVRNAVDIDGWPNVNLTRGPGRSTRAQRKHLLTKRLP